MKLFKLGAAFILAFALSLLVYAQEYKWATPIEKPGLGNFYQVDKDVYRGQQPTKEGFKTLHEMGIKTIINFRATNKDPKLIGDLPLNYIDLGTATWNVNDKDATAFIKVMANPDNYPVFFHCRHGADRTGTMAAIYRMVFQDWPREEAIKEMVEGPYGHHKIIWRNLPKYLKKFDIEKFKLLKQQEEAKYK